jgi:hypothetical protein
MILLLSLLLLLTVGHCATSQKDAGSITYAVTGYFKWPNPYSRTMTLGVFSLKYKWLSGIFLSTKNGWQERKAENLTAICLENDSLNISQAYKPPRPVIGIALAFFIYVDDIRTSQETHLWASRTCYRNSFTFLYVNDVRTSQETHLWASKICYRNSFTFL